MTEEYKQRIRGALDRFYARVSAGSVPDPKASRRARRPGPPTEHQEQAVFVDWMLAHRILYFAVPGGAYFGKKDAIHGARLKRIGLKPGIPDLVIVTRPPSRPGFVVAVEMKRSVGGRLSQNQKDWQAKLEDNEWWVIVGHGADDAIQQMQALGYGQRSADEDRTR